MAKRPVFIPVANGPALVSTKFVEFTWFPGMAVSQKQKSISSLHRAAVESLDGVRKVLEVSSKSPENLGVALSAFNLEVRTPGTERAVSVECAFQSSKVFEHGGPYTDLLNVTPREAKQDERLRGSGRLTGFRYFGVDWALEPQTAFYDWLYVNALDKQPALGEALLDYSAFTDIEFNPERSINCQAYSAALFVAGARRNLLRELTASKDSFLRVVAGVEISKARIDETRQRSFRF